MLGGSCCSGHHLSARDSCECPKRSPRSVAFAVVHKRGARLYCWLQPGEDKLMILPECRDQAGLGPIVKMLTQTVITFGIDRRSLGPIRGPRRSANRSPLVWPGSPNGASCCPGLAHLPTVLSAGITTV